ncbi:MAG: polyphosphate:AMP phosphotransferase [Oscillospiraceae bacterium]|nr:polyphosphate:AMP phosphotransferase [Oscillospiraceae bacterium]
MLKEIEKQSDAAGKDELKTEIKELRAELTAMQERIKESKLPIIVLVEGWAAAGKGSLINELISEIDPRFYKVVSSVFTPQAESRYPFLYPYAGMIPENGKILFMDGGWMEDAVRKYIHREITEAQYKDRIREINEFERQLRDAGYLVLKIFLHISKKEQTRRLANLLDRSETDWRVSQDDLWQHREYEVFFDTYDKFMGHTNDAVKWHILDGEQRRLAVRDAMRLLKNKVQRALEKGRYVGKPFEEDFPLLKMPKLADVDLSPNIPEADYKKELKKLQKRLNQLHNVVYRKKIPVVLCFEGWDASGKGGNIRRLTYPLDPRGFDVIPIASPLPHELARQYLWRFWTKVPRSGHFAIFDRTWYGRVMVERLEGFCAEQDWKRAYNEINEFERCLTDWGAVVLKFWIHIDQETQLERFNARQNTPEKQWKITEEDWRNREKWPLYEQAVDEMLAKTSTENAPWHIIESNDKKYARLKVLRIVIEAIEDAIDSQIKRDLK